MDEVIVNNTLWVSLQDKKMVKNDLSSCRVCMKTSSEEVMCNIFDSSCDILHKVLYCTGIQFTKEDGLPPYMCTKCLQDLSIAYNFKQLCSISYTAFKTSLKNELVIKKVVKEELKVEVDDDVDNDDWGVNSDDIIKEECIDDDTTKKEYVGNDETDIEQHSAKETKVRKKRGPYKKSGKPRLKKLKFRRLYCEPCNQKFATKSQLDEHRRQLHKVQDIESWICEVCGKVFVHRASLSSHMRSHLPPEFACDRCDYNTANKYDLIKHIRIHDGDKRFQCQHCPASYHTSSNLSSHIRYVHVKEKKFSCEMCGKKFFDRTKHARHMDSHNNVKRFECEVCHSCFTRRCYWKKHLLRQHNIVIPPQRPGRARLNVAGLHSAS